MRRRFAFVFWFVLLAAVLYLPVRREVLNRGWLPSGTFVSAQGESITVYGDGRYQSRGRNGEKSGRFTAERFPDIPYLSLIRLDTGELLHVRYDNSAHWLDEVSDLSSAETTYHRK